ncbi:MmgE/PrpD family protein [Rhizobium lusitanum]|nr:MmgE/PrpD family protein [Rhizobium lusitanum]
MTATSQIAQYASATTMEALPKSIQERTKKIIFDELACAYFGRRSAAGSLSAQYAISLGGQPEALVYGSNIRLPAAYAALANGTAGHGEEVDGAHVVGGHPGASIVHAAMALAERQRVSGAELVNAVTLGYDIGTRAVEACGGTFVVRDRHGLTSCFLYAYGATAAAARLLRLDAVRHAHALALVSFQTNGPYALFSEKRHISKSFCNGQFAFAGISAALMSAAGLEGNEDILGGKQGVLDAWGIQNGRQILTRGLGQEFSVNGANFKFFNAGYPIHTPVEAVLTLMKQHAIAPEMIDVLLVGMPENAMRVVDNRHMHNICVQDMVSAAVARGGIKLTELPFPAVLSDPTFQRIRALISVEPDPDLQRDQPNGRGAKVTIGLRSGQTFAMRVDHPRGHSQRGDISWDDLAEKWRDALPGCDVEAAMSVAQDLDDLEDVSLLSRAFAGLMA